MSSDWKPQEDCCRASSQKESRAASYRNRTTPSVERDIKNLSNTKPPGIGLGKHRKFFLKNLVAKRELSWVQFAVEIISRVTDKFQLPRTCLVLVLRFPHPEDQDSSSQSLQHGPEGLAGENAAPHHTSSYCGVVCPLIGAQRAQ